MNYAIIQNGIIVNRVNSVEGVDRLRKLFPDAERIEPVPDEFPALADVDERVVDWTTHTVKPLSQQVSEGIVIVPEGSKLDGEEIRPMTQVERIEAGLDELPAGLKIADGQLVHMPRDERYDAGQITVEQYNDEVRQERHRRYVTESDPLRDGWVADREAGRDAALIETARQAWLDKVQEIKAALPLKAV